ncbi:MAG: hypothetical protein KAV87_20845 [Desulfobacteraceae bacterium]|nr:hypothetical protein [Desulfobacteraceae bacterium]
MKKSGVNRWKLSLLFFMVALMSRANVSNAAEKEIHRYKDNNYLWAKHVCNVELRPIQLIWMDQMDRFNLTVLVAPPRVGKTFAVEIHGLKACAVNPWEDYRIFAPKEKQGADSLRYQIDEILDSPVLSAFVETRLGRKQIRSTGYTFQNGSNTEYYGQNSRLDGVNATVIRGEEFDDINIEIWKDRILPRGMAVNRNGLPTRIRLTGVIQGRENLFLAERDANFDTLKKIDIYDALAMKIIDESYINILREQYSDDMWLRIALVKYVESRNFFHSKHLRAIQKAGQKVNIEPVIPEPGGRYEAGGRVGVGFDMGAQGSSSSASKYSIHFMDKIGMFKRWLYGEEFDPTMDPRRIRRRVVELWDYFRPVGGFADAFDSNLVAQINDDLYAEGLISYNRQREHAENKVENWKHWTLQPIRFQGAVKHQMFKGLQNAIHQHLLYTPMVVAGDEKYDVLKRTINQLANIRSAKGGASYLLYEMIKKALGDDNVDTLAMCNEYLDGGKDNTLIVEGYGSGQRLAGLNAGAGDFLT